MAEYVIEYKVSIQLFMQLLPNFKCHYNVKIYIENIFR